MRPPPRCWNCGRPAETLYVIDPFNGVVLIRRGEGNKRYPSRPQIGTEVLCGPCTDTVAEGR